MDDGRAGQGNRYLLREAGGAFWLLDTRQPGVPYRAPIRMNETGARLWRLREEGLTLEEMARRIGEEEGVPPQEIRPDLETFFQEIDKQRSQGESGV